MTTSFPLMAAGGPSYFPLMESNQRSRQKKASARPAGSYAFVVLRTSQKLNRHSRHTPGPLFCQAFARFCSGFNKIVDTQNDFLFPSAEQLRPKSDKTMVASSVGRGIAIVADALARANEVGQHFAARGFA